MDVKHERVKDEIRSSLREESRWSQFLFSPFLPLLLSNFILCPPPLSNYLLLPFTFAFFLMRARIEGEEEKVDGGEGEEEENRNEKLKESEGRS